VGHRTQELFLFVKFIVLSILSRGECDISAYSCYFDIIYLVWSHVLSWIYLIGVIIFDVTLLGISWLDAIAIVHMPS